MFALLRSYTALSFWQVMVAVMSLDITSAIVQMALSQKDTLASRWWVVLNSISQLLVQVCLGIVLSKTLPISSAKQDPCQPCVRVVWWGTFDSCGEVPWTFWIYWTLRTLLVIRSGAIGLHHMHFYDIGERIARDENSGEDVSWSSHLLRHLTLTDPLMLHSAHARRMKVWSQEAFSRMPATTLTDWAFWMLPAIVAMSSLERMLSLFELSNPGNIEDWGQTTTFMAVICGLVARAVYLFYAKLKRRSCLERTKAAMDHSKLSTARKINLSTEDFATLTSRLKSFRDARQVLKPVDCVRWKLHEEVWYEEIDLEEAEEEFLKSAVLNDINGLVKWARYIPDISTAVDDMNRTALHLALDKNNLEAIETIMDLIVPEPQSGRSPATTSRNLQKLLDASDKTKRTPWKMIMPTEYDQMHPKTLEAFLRFRYPVRQPGITAPLSRIINMIFTLPYALKVLQAWVGAAEKSHSLRQLEECMIQAVAIDDRPHNLRDKGSIEKVYEFWSQQHNMGRAMFADRLFKTFVDSVSRCSWKTPGRIPSYLTQFIREKKVWAMESHTSIVRIVATSGRNVDDVKFLIEHHPQRPRIDEQILIGAVSNHRIRLDLIRMMSENWPDQVDITSKVLEAFLASSPSIDDLDLLLLLLRACPHQIQVTESMLMSLARGSASSVPSWMALLEHYRPQIEMTQHVFDATVKNLFQKVGSAHSQDISVFREFLNQWPSETKIRSPVLLSLLQNGNRLEIFDLLYELRHDELGTAIDREVIIELGDWSTQNESGYDENRVLVNFFFERYPEQCKAYITNDVLNIIGRNEYQRDWASDTEDYFKAFQQGSIVDRFGRHSGKL